MIVVTGASGFVGRETLAAAVRGGLDVRGIARRTPDAPIAGVDYRIGPELSASGDWTAALAGTDVVVHAAARVHVMRDAAGDPLLEYRRVNVEGTMALARQAVAAGARRFVFLSSIKVNGERTMNGRPFRATDAPAPIDAYGVSKHEAEEALRQLERKTGLEVVVIRPVLVYGPGVKANFAAMMRWLRRRVPLPLGAIRNRRSFVALPNLVDLLLVCASDPAAAGQTFLVSDGEDLSTTELLRRLSAALGVDARLIAVPQGVLRLAARLAGREDLGRRLFESLQVDIEPTKSILGWAPPVSVDEALRDTARDLLRREPPP